ncbi:WxL domain-containing protein [Loigolactobacillus zhaoyuanensis]|uniref:WxL domain-containing protein n=1 Tax=Loigolactobacillus zhaoyuanensis TaxID=2486017 RepID=UPI000F739B11|nr:WxL domain-containing protein [Loigolactobacillus zhaoyuanensis]
MNKLMRHLGWWFACILLLVVGGAATKAVAATYYPVTPTDSLWQNWQKDPVAISKSLTIAAKSATSGNYNFQIINQTKGLGGLISMTAGDTTPTVPALQFTFQIPNIGYAQGKPNYQASVVPTFTVAVNGGTPITVGTPTITEYKLGAKYYTQVVMPKLTFATPLRNTDQLTLNLKIKLQDTNNSGSPTTITTIVDPVSAADPVSPIIPQVIKVFARDSATGADLTTTPTIFGKATSGYSLDGELGNQTNTATAATTVTSNGTTYRYGGGQLFNGNSSTAFQTVDSKTLSIANLKTTLLKQAVMFWYNAKDSKIPVYYVDANNKVIDTASTTPAPTSQAWGYNNGNIYKDGTTSETSANLLTAPKTLTNSGGSYALKDYAYYGNFTGSGVPTTTPDATGTDITQQTLAGQVGKEVIVFRYENAPDEKFGVHYWNIDVLGNNTPTNTSTANDSNSSNPPGFAFQSTAGSIGSSVDVTDNQPIDSNGSGGVAAPKAPLGWSYIGYRYNDGSGTTKWVAYDPTTPSTARFKGKFVAGEQGISFLYRDTSKLALTVPDELDFGTMATLANTTTSTELKSATIGGTVVPDGPVVAVTDMRDDATPTNSQLDPWHVTVAGSTLTGDSTGQVADTAIKLSNGSAEGSGQLATAINIPLDSQTIVPVLDNTTLGGMTDTIASWQYANVTLDVPAGHVMGPDTYHSILTWTLTSGY